MALAMATAAAAAMAVWVAGCGPPTRTKPGFCRSDRECAAGQRCDTVLSFRCVCAGDDCPDGGPSDAGGGGSGPTGDGGAADTGCSSNAGCPTGRPVCVASRCVECESHGQCTDPARAFCVANACVGCAAAGPNPCAMPTPVCGARGACVECLAHGDCARVDAPICDTTTNRCGKCSSDAECAARGGGPGICMSHQDGRCAAEAESIHVSKAAGCASTGGAGAGVAAMPLCSPQSAVEAVSPTRRVIVVRGPAAVSGLRWAPAQMESDPVTVVGQQGAVLSGGADPGVRVSAGELYVRNVVVRSSEDTGVVAEPGAVIRLDRVTVQGNRRGGLRATGAGFDVVNCLFADNGGGTVDVVTFGGAFLGPTSPGAPARFRFNTVAGNADRGVVCAAPGQRVEASLLVGNMGGAASPDHINCVLAGSPTSADGDPRLVPTTHRLTAASPCRNGVAGMPSDPPAVDLDGDPRPAEGKYDCGADEFTP